MSATAGPNFPTTVTGNTGTIGAGSVAWGNPTNAEAADVVFATCVIPDTQTGDDLIGKGFGFAIPSTATIAGITLEVGVRENTIVGGGATDNFVILLKAGSAVGSSLANGALISTALTTITYGGSSNLWGTTWTPADINNANFGAAISYLNSTGGGTSRTVSVDFMRITVTYNADANVNATGVSATGSIGTAVASGTAVKAVTGVSATGSIGTVVPAVSANVVGIASTTHLGTATFSGTATIAVTGVSSTSHLGTAIATISVPVSGVSASGSIGSVTAKGTANINVVGISSTASLGNVRIDAVVNVSGLQATASLGQVIDKLFAIVGGVSSTAHLGTVSVEVRSRMPVVVWIN
jgi:hypothetical protein